MYFFHYHLPSYMPRPLTVELLNYISHNATGLAVAIS